MASWQVGNSSFQLRYSYHWISQLLASWEYTNHEERSFTAQHDH